MSFPFPNVKSIIAEKNFAVGEQRLAETKINLPVSDFNCRVLVMLIYVLFGISLTLASFTGLQFFYMYYLERINKEHKSRIYELERHSKYLSKRLKEAEQQITEQNDLIETIFDNAGEEEVWADVIEDR